MLLRDIADWRFAVWHRTDWLSQEIHTFLDNLQHVLDCLRFGLKGRTPHGGRYGIGMVAGRITLVAGGNQDASSSHFCTVLHRAIFVDGMVV